MSRTCPRCGETDQLKFGRHKRAKDGLYPVCKKCNCAAVKRCYHNNPQPRIDYAAAWHKANRAHSQEIKNDSQRRLRAEAKKLAFDHYGNKCACCGETELVFLQIDHVNNDGAVHRKGSGGLRGASICQWLIKKNFPEGFQILCRNCNFSKPRNGGVCVHQGIKAVEPIDAQDESELKRLQRNLCQRALNARHRNTVLDHYGRCCACCGLAEEKFLEIDHKNNDGSRQREGRGGTASYQKIVADGFPADLQTLCGNCNFARRMSGVCPHQAFRVVKD